MPAFDPLCGSRSRHSFVVWISTQSLIEPQRAVGLHHPKTDVIVLVIEFIPSPSLIGAADVMARTVAHVVIETSRVLVRFAFALGKGALVCARTGHLLLGLFGQRAFSPCGVVPGLKPVHIHPRVVRICSRCSIENFQRAYKLPRPHYACT